MQCSSFFPGHYPRQDLNGSPNGGPWLYTNDINVNMNSQSYNNFYPSPNVDRMRAVYHNEILRQTILSHENVFREQVQELHRLHRRQGELMDEFKRRGLQQPIIAPTSHYNIILSKVSSDCSSMTWQTNPAANKIPTPGSLSPLSAFNFLDASPQNENGFENSELLPKFKKPKPKILDLELPGYEYIDSEDENGDEIQKKSTFCSNDTKANMLTFDLNMTPEPEMFPNLEIKHEAKPYLIDLNSCVDEDITIANIDLEPPLSPENKDTLPPRRESEENSLAAPIPVPKVEDSDLNYDLVAAETILSFNDGKSASLIRSLDWFVGVLVSSGSEKEETECVVALPSQQGKRHRKRRINRKVLERESYCSNSPVMSCNLGFSDKRFRSWGKVNKRRRRLRVPASRVRLLWN